MSVLPSLKFAFSIRKNGVLDAPHVGISKLLQDPFTFLYFAFGLHLTRGAHCFKKSSFVVAMLNKCNEFSVWCKKNRQIINRKS